MSRKVQHHSKELDLLKDKQDRVYQETSLVLGLLSLDTHSLWVPYFTVSLVFLFWFVILNVHIIYDIQAEDKLIACTIYYYFWLISPYDFSPDLLVTSSQIGFCFFDIRNALDSLTCLEIQFEDWLMCTMTWKVKIQISIP